MTKSYAIKEIFHSLQGEGFHAGKATVFVRFSGCNLWSGLEEHRSKATCQFCDTDFVGGSRYTLEQIVEEARQYPTRFMVLTGGEPALQIDNAFVRRLQREGFYVAIETNGSLPIPSALDWVCVSPKANTDVVVREADELKLVYPQPDLPPHIASIQVNAKHRWISPMDGPNLAENTQRAVEFCKHATPWRLNIQAHKIWGIR